MIRIITTIFLITIAETFFISNLANSMPGFIDNNSIDDNQDNSTILIVERIRPIPVNKTNAPPDNNHPKDNNKLQTRLSITNQNLNSIPLIVYSYPNLEYLDLSNNNLNSIPDDFKQLTKIKEIRLNNNKFVNFPQNLLSNPTLENIDLSNNKILNLNCDLSQLINVKKLNLSHNSMA